MNDIGGCRAAIGTLTAAMRAQSVLGRAAIPTAVIKYTEGERGRGCVYGIAFACAQRENTETVLRGERIRVREWKAGS